MCICGAYSFNKQIAINETQTDTLWSQNFLLPTVGNPVWEGRRGLTDKKKERKKEQKKERNNPHTSQTILNRSLSCHLLDKWQYNMSNQIQTKRLQEHAYLYAHNQN